MTRLPMLTQLKPTLAKIPKWVVFPFLTILAFGVFVPKLGFYWDDWPILYFIDSKNLSGLITYYSFDRPYAAYLGIAASFFAGTSSLLWQVLVLGLRLSTALTIWAVLKNLGSRFWFFASTAALLFLIYPGYDTQPMNSTYAHWVTYLLFFLSLYGTGKAVKDSKQAALWTGLALLAQAINIFSLEFFVVLELVRPVYIALLLKEKGWLALLKRTIRYWLPFLGLLLIWFVWRFFILVLPGEPHPLQMLVDLRNNPIQALMHYGMLAVSDVFYLCVLVWSETVSRLSSITNFWWLLVASCSALLGLLFLVSSSPSKAPTTREALIGMALGAAGVFFGLAPVWAIGDAANSGGYGSHYLLGGLFGASVFTASALCLARSRQVRLAIFVALSLLATGRQLSVSSEFVSVWEEQRTFYWQLYWRAPMIEPNTALVFFYPISDYMQQSSTSMAINTLYPHALNPTQLSFWTFDIRRTLVQRPLEREMPLQTDYRRLSFQARNANSQLFLYKLEDSCVWALTPIHFLNDYIPSDNRQLLQSSNVESINSVESFAPDQSTFGKEPDQTWCYYFEKADLAAQEMEWTLVLNLMREAESLGLRANYALEYMPLLRAYAYTDQWVDFFSNIVELNEDYPQGGEMMCALFQELEQSATGSGEKDLAINSSRDIYSCKN